MPAPGSIVMTDSQPVRSGPVMLPATVTDQTSAIIAVIERAATNPDIDVEKMERLLAMQERILTRQASAAYMAALAQMQPKLPPIPERGGIKDRSGNVQSTYALWEDIVERITPVLAEHGFAISFRVGQTDSVLQVTGVLTHREGHSEQTTIPLPLDSSGSKNAVQSVGSSVSYGKRYTASALLNLTSRPRDPSQSEDDDGQRAGRRAERPEIPHDVRIALQEAAKRGTDELKSVWSGISQPTRDIVTGHHSAWWNEQKAIAQRVQA